MKPAPDRDANDEVLDENGMTLGPIALEQWTIRPNKWRGDALDVMAGAQLPVIEVPPCLTLRQFLEIYEG